MSSILRNGFLSCLTCKMIAVMTLIVSPLTSKALEVYATATPSLAAPALNTTTNPLVMADSSTATVYIWLSYSAAERSTINTDGGLFGGGFQLPLSNPTWANIVSASDIQEADANGGINWGSFSSTTPPPPAAAFFSLGGFALPDQAAILVAKATITSNVYSGTPSLASLAANPTAGNEWYTVNLTQLNPTYSQFNVVPEPSSYVLASIACVMFGVVAKRKKSRQVSLLARRGALS